MFDVFIRHTRITIRVCVNIEKNNHSGDNCVISIDPASLGSVGGWNAFSDIV